METTYKKRTLNLNLFFYFIFSFQEIFVQNNCEDKLMLMTDIKN